MVFCTAACLGAAGPVSAWEWKAGVAVAAVTPSEPLWMAGYAARDRPSEGVAQDLFAKALAIDDGAGGRLVIVTMDQHMVPRGLREFVERETGARYGLKPEELLINASHTHCGPELRTEERYLARASPELRAAARRYREQLEHRLVELVGEALDRSAPARLEHSHAYAGFAMNRRRPEPDGRISLNANPFGPVDHEVPILKVTGTEGAPVAVLFGYACHNTTFGSSEYRIHGDYAGHAQAFVEAALPGAAALFLAGCGGDQNPVPRVNLVPGRPAAELARDHGRTLADAVLTAAAAGLKPVRGPLRPVLDSVDLPYRILPREEIQRRVEEETSPAVRGPMASVLEKMDSDALATTHPWPIQLVQFGPDLTLIAIGGEVVVDYSLRLKRELAGSSRVWVSGYSNDGYAYIGSSRVISEGGYEGYSANLRLLIHPGPWDPSIEETIVGKVHELRRLAEP